MNQSRRLPVASFMFFGFAAFMVLYGILHAACLEFGAQPFFAFVEAAACILLGINLNKRTKIMPAICAFALPLYDFIFGILGANFFSVVFGLMSIAAGVVLGLIILSFNNCDTSPRSQAMFRVRLLPVILMFVYCGFMMISIIINVAGSFSAYVWLGIEGFGVYEIICSIAHFLIPIGYLLTVKYLYRNGSGAPAKQPVYAPNVQPVNAPAPTYAQPVAPAAAPVNAYVEPVAPAAAPVNAYVEPVAPAAPVNAYVEPVAPAAAPVNAYVEPVAPAAAPVNAYVEPVAPAAAPVNAYVEPVAPAAPVNAYVEPVAPAAAPVNAYVEPVAPAAPVNAYVEPVAPAAAPVQTNAQTSVADEIMKYKNLLDMGAITQEQFEAKKNQLLGL